MAKPHPGEPHQLLRADGDSHQHCRQMDVFNQQSVEQPKCEYTENSQTKLKLSQL